MGKQSKSALPQATTTQPTYTAIHDPSGVLILQFSTISSLQKCLERPHIAYEGAELRGPLKGVNFPVMHLLQWATMIRKENLTKDELEMFSLIRTKNKKSLMDWENVYEKQLESRYLLACVAGDMSTMLHEWAHAVYYLDEDYKRLSHQLYEQLPGDIKEIIDKELAFRNYRDDVFVDEFQAYVVEGPSELGKKLTMQLMQSHKMLKEKMRPMPLLK